MESGLCCIERRMLLLPVLCLLWSTAVLATSDPVLERRITVQLDDIVLSDALEVIAVKAGCSFSYSNTLLNSRRRVSASYERIPLRDVLADLLKNELGSIRAHGNKVLLVAAAGHIRGAVFTAAGEPLSHVTIRIDGAAFGTATRADGTFSLKIPEPGSCTLVASAVGFEAGQQQLQITPGQSVTINFHLKEAAIRMDEVVITAGRDQASTATRTDVAIKDLPMPVMLIEGKQLDMMGSRRLNEVLQEQTGLALTTDPSGASNALGLQVQGFDASYTMIMIDGQPLIGRNATGILDLSRITIAHIQRIEIIKGTSSALYGSDALAGVVNIVTKRQSAEGTQGMAALRYGTNNMVDATLDGSTTLLKDKASLAVSTNYYRTDGFDADGATPGKTLPPFNSYALQAKLNYRMTPRSLMTTSVRHASRDQRNRYDLDRMGEREDINVERDLTASVVLRHTLSRKADLQAQYYFTQYQARTESTSIQTGERLNENEFRQYLHRLESFINYDLAAGLKITTGLGGNAEVLRASRYGSARQMDNGFMYVQAHYTLKEKLGLLGGARYDVHTIYGSQVSPRFGMRYTVSDKLVLKATAGTGFKAPGFQQLYLSFTNPSAGYTVLGAAVFDQEVARMQGAGEIRDLYPVAALVGDLKAERSVSFNGGFMLIPSAAVTLEVNAFHNTIRNMIFEELVGVKENGSQLFSYRNIDQAFTRGIETNVRWRLTGELEISAGHQLLYAKDQGVVDDIRAGRKTVRTAEGRSHTAEPGDYFNLSNRSRHMANVKVFYEYRALGLNASVRATYRGKYGIGDRNYPNNFIDPYDLYAEGYLLFHASVEKRLFQRRMGVQLICDNIGDYGNPLIPNLPGRQFITALSWRFEKHQPE
jgi:outer membrane receptor for ferrienterochelin and colicins